jgi:hypothetical protein
MRLQVEDVAKRLHSAEAQVLNEFYNVAPPRWFAFNEKGKDLVRARARLLMDQWERYEPVIEGTCEEIT